MVYCQSLLPKKIISSEAYGLGVKKLLNLVLGEASALTQSAVTAQRSHHRLPRAVFLQIDSCEHRRLWWLPAKNLHFNNFIIAYFCNLLTLTYFKNIQGIKQYHHQIFWYFKFHNEVCNNSVITVNNS